MNHTEVIHIAFQFATRPLEYLASGREPSCLSARRLQPRDVVRGPSFGWSHVCHSNSDLPLALHDSLSAFIGRSSRSFSSREATKALVFNARGEFAICGAFPPQDFRHRRMVWRHSTESV